MCEMRNRAMLLLLFIVWLLHSCNEKGRKPDESYSGTPTDSNGDVTSRRIEKWIGEGRCGDSLDYYFSYLLDSGSAGDPNGQFQRVARHCVLLKCDFRNRNGAVIILREGGASDLADSLYAAVHGAKLTDSSLPQ